MTTKFLYLSDTHLGANPPGYQQQRACPELLPEIMGAMQKYIEEEGVQFVLHGGDMIDFTTAENIRAAVRLFEILSVPVYLCLGNHDLTTPDALQQWLHLAPHFFPDGKPEYSIRQDCAIHVVPNHWGNQSYYWKDVQEMSFDSQQLDFLENALAASPDRPHLLLTHGPAFGLPPQQTGLEEEYHTPNPAFTRHLADLAMRYPHLRCVLGAHNHLNMCIARHETYFVTTSALVETPFEMKLFEVTPEAISMSTVTLGNRMSRRGEYNFEKTFVQGRPVDRGFIWGHP